MEETTTTSPSLPKALSAISGVALAAALVPLAEAQIFEDGRASSRVDANVNLIDDINDPNNGKYLYQFEVNNTSGGGDIEGQFPMLIDWELPLFALSDVVGGSIMSPNGWTHELVDPLSLTGPTGLPDQEWDYNASTDPTIDPNQGGTPGLYGPNPEVFENPPLVLHWYTENCAEFGCLGGIVPGGELAGFSFISDFGSQNAPYTSSWFFQPPVTGDPPIPNEMNAFGSPNSPARMAAQNPTSSVPEPSALLLVGTTLLSASIFGAGLRRRKRKAQ